MLPHSNAMVSGDCEENAVFTTEPCEQSTPMCCRRPPQSLPSSADKDSTSLVPPSISAHVLFPSSSCCSSQPTEQSCQHSPECVPQLLFLDLDNTLIPTAWMMEQWKLAVDLPCTTTDFINKRLEKAGLFSALDNFFGELVALKGQQCIVIVTNAATKTVHDFYLSHCIPQFKDIIMKYNIPIRSTQPWVDECGPVPHPYRQKEFREYYTNIKFLQFEKELNQFRAELEAQERTWLGFEGKKVTYNKANVERTDNTDEAYTKRTTHRCRQDQRCSSVGRSTSPVMDIISVGDQLCEITAAIRLGVTNNVSVRRMKLLMIMDCIGDRFVTLTPEEFVENLTLTATTIKDLLESETLTTVRRTDDACAREQWFRPSYPCLDLPSTSDINVLKETTIKLLSHDHRYNLSDVENMAVWVSKSKRVAYCIAEPHHFDVLEYYPLTSALISSESGVRNNSSTEDCDALSEHEHRKCSSSISDDDSYTQNLTHLQDVENHWLFGETESQCCAQWLIDREFTLLRAPTTIEREVTGETAVPPPSDDQISESLWQSNRDFEDEFQDYWVPDEEESATTEPPTIPVEPLDGTCSPVRKRLSLADLREKRYAARNCETTENTFFASLLPFRDTWSSLHDGPSIQTVRPVSDEESASLVASVVGTDEIVRLLLSRSLRDRTMSQERGIRVGGGDGADRTP